MGFRHFFRIECSCNKKPIMRDTGDTLFPRIICEDASLCKIHCIYVTYMTRLIITQKAN